MRLLWKIYFVAFLIMGIISLLGETQKGIYYWIDCGLSISALFIIYALAYNKKLSPTNLWRTLAILFVLIDLLYNLAINNSWMSQGRGAGLILIIFFPAYFACLKYFLNKHA